MERRQGKIEEKTLKFAKNKKSYATFTIDGMNYNTFDKEIVDNHNPDDFVEFTGDTNAKGFWELKTMKKIYEPVPGERKAQASYQEWADKQPKNGAKEYHLSPEEVKCRALECALQHRMIYKASEENILELADKFVEWIRNGN